MPTLKHKVTLREKHAEIVTSLKEPTPKRGNNWWIWISTIIVVLLLCVGAYFLLNKENEEIIQPTEVTELVTSQPGEDNETNEPVISEGSNDNNESENYTDQEVVDVNNVEVATNENNSATVEDSPTANDNKTEQNIPSKQPSSSTTSNDVNSSELSGSLEQKARRVIRGDFGNGKVRKQKLGNEYQQIQDKVNEMYRLGNTY